MPVLLLKNQKKNVGKYLDMPDDPDGDKLIVNGNYIPLEKVGTQYTKGGE